MRSESTLQCSVACATCSTAALSWMARLARCAQRACGEPAAIATRVTVHVEPSPRRWVVGVHGKPPRRCANEQDRCAQTCDPSFHEPSFVAWLGCMASAVERYCTQKERHEARSEAHAQPWPLPWLARLVRDDCRSRGAVAADEAWGEVHAEPPSLLRVVWVARRSRHAQVEEQRQG